MENKTQYTPATIWRVDVAGMVHNLVVFGIISYSVFVLGYSGWWFGIYFASRFWISWGKRKGLYLN
jgi:hypothetical protein